MKILKYSSWVLIGLFSSQAALAADPPDVRRADAAQAIISYQAKLAEQQRLNSLREAPGSANALASGESLSLYSSQSANYSSLLSALISADANYQLTVPASDPQLQYYRNNATNPANMDISTLLSQKRLSSASQAAVQQLVINITNPVPAPMSVSLAQALKASPMPTQPGATPTTLELPQQIEYVQRQMAQSLYSVAQRSFYEVMATRLPITNDPSGNSLLEVIDKESSWRMETPTWFVNLSVTPTEGVLREMAQMDAMRLWLQYQQYRQAERAEVLLATMVAAQARVITQIQQMQQSAQSAQTQAASALPHQ